MDEHAASGGHSGQDQNCGLHSVFHLGFNEVLFFDDLHITSGSELLGACVVVFVVALLNEGLRLLVSWLQGQVNTPQTLSPSMHPPLRSEQSVWVMGAAHTFTYMLHLFLHYCLMLVFMALNVWLCLALLLGAGTGFLLFHFRPLKSRVFRLLGMRSEPLVTEGGEEKEDNYSEMTDMTDRAKLEDLKWNGGGGVKEK